MNASRMPHGELGELLANLLEDRLDDSGRERLTELLRDNPTAQAVYLDYIAIHAFCRMEYSCVSDLPEDQPAECDPLWEECCSADEYAILEEPDDSRPVKVSEDPFPVTPDLLAERGEESSPGITWEGLLPWLAAVAAFAAVVFGISRWELPAALDPVAENGEQPLPAAWISFLHEVEWAPGQLAYGWGGSLTAGRTLRLQSGLVRLVFSSGAEVLLQGPVSFTAETAELGRLHQGKLVARAETERARGFTIRTPTAQIVDLGTEFGVFVDAQGRTETHVFAGRVLAQAVGVKQTTREPLRLDAGQAARVESHQVGFRPMAAAAPETFVRQTPPRQVRPVLHYAMEEAQGPLVDRQGRAKAVPNDKGGFHYRQPGVPPGTYGAIQVGPEGTGFSAGLNDATAQWNLDTAATARLNLSNNFTVMTWLYLPAAPKGVVKVVGQGITNPARGWAFGVREAGEGRGVFFSACGVKDFYSDTAIPWAGGQWHHIALTKSSAEGVRLYLDGDLVAVDNSRSAHGDLYRLAGDASYCLGRGNDYIEEPGDGRRIDEFCVFDVALTREEIVLVASGRQ
jgi:hypothetical protein